MKKSNYIILVACSLISMMLLCAIGFYLISGNQPNYQMQGTFSAGNAPELTYLVIDDKNNFSMYTSNGSLLHAGQIEPSGEDNHFILKAEGTQVFGLYRIKKGAYMFDSSDWVYFSRDSSAIRIFN